MAALPAAPKPTDAKPSETRAPSIDFGTLPPAASIRPEPLSNWQDREVPKAISTRPGLAADPVLTPPAPKAPAAVALPVVTPPVSMMIAAAAPAALVYSFAVDTLHLLRRR